MKNRTCKWSVTTKKGESHRRQKDKNINKHVKKQDRKEMKNNVMDREGILNEANLKRNIKMHLRKKCKKKKDI